MRWVSSQDLLAPLLLKQASTVSFVVGLTQPGRTEQLEVHHIPNSRAEDCLERDSSPRTSASWVVIDVCK